MMVLYFLGVAAFTATVLSLALAWLSRALGRSRFLTRHYVNLAYGSKKCTYCTFGTQYLHPDRGWGPIPDHLKFVRPGEKYTGTRQANVRSCNWCNASGHMSFEIPGMIDQGHVEIPR